MTKIRFDRGGRLARAGRTPSGGVRIAGRLARTGVQVYRMPDGSTRREYRAPEEVFSADALASFVGAPITVDHPPDRVDPFSWRSSVGVVLRAPARTRVGSHEFVEADSLDVNDAAAIGLIESGDLVEISAGYSCDFDAKPGVDPATGEQFDGYQRNIRINHVALLPEGRARAGREARLLVDAVEEIDPAELSFGRQVLPESWRDQINSEARSWEKELDRRFGTGGDSHNLRVNVRGT